MKTRIYHLCSSQHSRANPNFKELFSKHWAYLGRSSASREFGRKDFTITYRKPPSLKDMLVREKIVQPRTTTSKGCKRPNTCKYYKKIPQSGKIKNLHNNKSYNTVAKGTCQSKKIDILPGMQLVPYQICRENKKQNHI